jgi:hypothetical protein
MIPKKRLKDHKQIPRIPKIKGNIELLSKKGNERNYWSLIRKRPQTTVDPSKLSSSNLNTLVH